MSNGNFFTRLRHRWYRWREDRHVDRLLNAATRCMLENARTRTFMRTGHELDEDGETQLRLAFLRSLEALGPQWLDVFLEHPTRYIHLFLSDYF